MKRLNASQWFLVGLVLLQLGSCLSRVQRPGADHGSLSILQFVAILVVVLGVGQLFRSKSPVGDEKRLPPFQRGLAHRLKRVGWVASAGLVFSVASKIRCSSSGVNTRRDRCRFRDSQIPAVPRLAKAARAARTVGRDRPVCWAIRWFDRPWLAIRMT